MRAFASFGRILIFCLTMALFSCARDPQTTSPSALQVIVLGVTQDAGSPQIGCTQECCKGLPVNKSGDRMVSCLAIYDPSTSFCILLDATPDITAQMNLLNSITDSKKVLPDAIFLTHAHIGHYTGLMYLGKESAATDAIPVYAMPRMRQFLMNNAPWSMLVAESYIKLKPLSHDSTIHIQENLKITPIEVPHRDEFSETVGFMVSGESKRLLYIPDIDKWDRWEREINGLIKAVDYAFLDGTFFDARELPGRDMNEIPHPFVVESVERFGKLTETDREKVHFIHFNHTNPLLKANSKQRKALMDKGYGLAEAGMVIDL